MTREELSLVRRAMKAAYDEGICANEETSERDWIKARTIKADLLAQIEDAACRHNWESKSKIIPRIYVCTICKSTRYLEQNKEGTL